MLTSSSPGWTGAPPPPNPIAARGASYIGAELPMTSLTLTTSLWRDFMPISPPDGKPLIAVMQIRTDDGSPVPAGIAADPSWGIYGDEVWSSFVEPRPRSETGPIYEVVARNGPKWGPGVSVDVVVRLRDAEGRVVLLRAEKQPITATH